MSQNLWFQTAKCSPFETVKHIRLDLTDLTKINLTTLHNPRCLMDLLQGAGICELITNSNGKHKKNDGTIKKSLNHLLNTKKAVLGTEPIKGHFYARADAVHPRRHSTWQTWNLVSSSSSWCQFLMEKYISNDEETEIRFVMSCDVTKVPGPFPRKSGSIENPNFRAFIGWFIGGPRWSKNSKRIPVIS